MPEIWIHKEERLLRRIIFECVPPGIIAPWNLIFKPCLRFQYIWKKRIKIIIGILWILYHRSYSIQIFCLQSTSDHIQLVFFLWNFVLQIHLEMHFTYTAKNFCSNLLFSINVRSNPIINCGTFLSMVFCNIGILRHWYTLVWKCGLPTPIFFFSSNLLFSINVRPTPIINCGTFSSMVFCNIWILRHWYTLLWKCALPTSKQKFSSNLLSSTNARSPPTVSAHFSSFVFFGIGIL